MLTPHWLCFGVVLLVVLLAVCSVVLAEFNRIAEQQSAIAVADLFFGSWAVCLMLLSYQAAAHHCHCLAVRQCHCQQYLMSHSHVRQYLTLS